MAPDIPQTETEVGGGGKQNGWQEEKKTKGKTWDQNNKTLFV